jgi:ligand-binding sensor domain-containing protein/two-component sensor histidine kinase
VKQLAALYFCVPILAAIGTFAEQLPVQVYTTADGLAHNHINCIRQDSRGFLWFCTDEGLTRFDGYRLISYTTRDGLPHPWINDLIETRDGALWIASDGGVSRFNPKGGMTAEPMFVNYVPDQKPDALRVNALAEDRSGAIWCATYNGLYRLDRDKGKVKFEWVDIGLTGDPSEPRLVNNLALDRRGWLWLGARTGLYRRFSDGRTEHYTTHHGLPDDFVGEILEDRKGRWWAATRVGGFCRLVTEPDPARRVVERCYSTVDGLPHNDVRSIFQSSDGKMWIGTILGLSEFAPNAAPGRLFHNYTTANGLSQQQIYRIVEDRDGNLWIGTRRSGLMKMARNGFISYRERDGFRSGTTHHDIFETARGELCVLTGTGSGGLIQRLVGQKFVATKLNLPHPKGLSDFFVENGLQDQTGAWWLATRHGLVHFPKTTQVAKLAQVHPKVYTTADGMPTDRIDRVYQDTRGVLWIATSAAPGPGELQLRSLSHPSGELHVYAVDRLGVRPVKGGTVAAIAADGVGDLWLGFRDCVVRCRGGQFERFFAAAPGIQGVVNALHLDRSGRLWIASTKGGLYRVDNPASTLPQIARYTTAEGLASNEILSLTEDQWGRIYAGNNRGVDRLDPASGFVKHYTSAEGLSKGAVALAYCDRQSVLWFVTDEGISSLTPTRDPDSNPPAILITGLRTMGVPHVVSAMGQARVEHLKLAPNQSQLQIDFLGLDFRPGERLRYQYKLESADRDWSAPATERTVNYASLASGSYRFLVRAVSSDGIASPEPATVTFTVLAPVWRQWWFLSLCALGMGLAIYGVHQLRVQQLLAVERIRMRIATDLHDDIGASLSHIAMLSEVAATEVGLGLAPNSARPDEPLARIGSVSRELIDSMSDIVWAISPRKDRLRSLTERMREFAGELLSTRNIEFDLQATGIDQEMKLDPEVRRQIFLIFKECVHNIVRHSGSTRVICDFRIEGRELVLRLSDNGRGFGAMSSNGPDRGHGLLSMRRRAESLGGRLELAAKPSQGVSVVLRVPFDHHAASFRIT